MNANKRGNTTKTCLGPRLHQSHNLTNIASGTKHTSLHKNASCVQLAMLALHKCKCEDKLRNGGEEHSQDL